MSEAVEKRIWELLDHPALSPYGNPIPGLEELGAGGEADTSTSIPLSSATDHRDADPVRVIIRRFDEPLQTEHELMAMLRRAGATPGATVRVSVSPGGLLVGSGGEYAEVPLAVADHIAVDTI